MARGADPGGLAHRGDRSDRRRWGDGGPRVSPQHARELAPDLLAAGIEILVVQGNIVSAEHVSRAAEPLNLVEFIASMDVPVIAGGVGDYRTAMHLMRTGAAGVIVGYGAGDSTSTADVLGI